MGFSYSIMAFRTPPYKYVLLLFEYLIYKKSRRELLVPAVQGCEKMPYLPDTSNSGLPSVYTNTPIHHI